MPLTTSHHLLMAPDVPLTTVGSGGLRYHFPVTYWQDVRPSCWWTYDLLIYLLHMRSSSLLSMRILNWPGCGRPRATCHCLSRYMREQSTWRPRAAVGPQHQSLRSSRLWAQNCTIIAKAAVRYRKTAADWRRGWVSVQNRRFRTTWRFETMRQFWTTRSPHVCRHHRWGVEAVAGSTCRQPSYWRRRRIILLRSASLCCTCCYAYGDCFFFYVHPPSVLTPFGYSALVPTVSLTPRLNSTLDCVSVLIFAESYIIE